MGSPTAGLSLAQSAISALLTPLSAKRPSSLAAVVDCRLGDDCNCSRNPATLSSRACRQCSHSSQRTRLRPLHWQFGGCPLPSQEGQTPVPLPEHPEHSQDPLASHSGHVLRLRRIRPLPMHRPHRTIFMPAQTWQPTMPDPLHAGHCAVQSISPAPLQVGQATGKSPSQVHTCFPSDEYVCGTGPLSSGQIIALSSVY